MVSLDLGAKLAYVNQHLYHLIRKKDKMQYWFNDFLNKRSSYAYIKVSFELTCPPMVPHIYINNMRHCFESLPFQNGKLFRRN